MDVGAGVVGGGGVGVAVGGTAVGATAVGVGAAVKVGDGVAVGSGVSVAVGGGVEVDGTRVTTAGTVGGGVSVAVGGGVEVDGTRVTAAGTVGGAVGVAVGAGVIAGKGTGVGPPALPQAATRVDNRTIKLAPSTRRHLLATTLRLNGIPIAPYPPPPILSWSGFCPSPLDITLNTEKIGLRLRPS